MPKDNPNTEKEEHPNEGVSIDLDSILLPDKELHTPANAQRASAGALLAQEQSATLQQPKPPTSEVKPAGLASGSPLAGGPSEPGTQVLPKKDSSSIAPLETYQSDIQKILGEQGASVVSIAAAQANRRAHPTAEGAREAAEANQTSAGVAWAQLGRRALFTLGGILLIAAAAGAVAYAILRPTSVAINAAPQVPFISVDDSKTFILQPQDAHAALMSDLQSLKSAEQLTPGLVASFVPLVASTSPNAPTFAMSAQQFLALLAPTIPTTLLRNLDASFLVGVHMFNNVNQPFVILSVDSYEQGYASMLAWEPTMAQDLQPFFPEAAISTPSNTSGQASTTPSTNSAQTVFTDEVILNHDARVLLDASGNPILLWTFLDRQTIVVTTNQYTLGEIISRLKSTSITVVPGQ